jgi:hypothetical protein
MMPGKQRPVAGSVGAPPLPYPIEGRILVFRDVGFGDGPWWQRSHHVLNDLLVGQYDLPEDDEGDLAMTAREWSQFAERLVSDHPECVFVYSSNQGVMR